MKKILQFFFIILFVAANAIAQEKVITGKVTGTDGLPIPGVSVKVKGTTVGVATTPNGSFSIKVPSNAGLLEISSIGFKTKEVGIGSANNLSIVMEMETNVLNDVVVMAYGTQKKESITGSVAKIGAEQLESRVISNVTQALAGAAPGISASSGNGQPGADAGIRIRGFGSVNASNSPLYVVDGFPYEGNISDINANDIESISILKDASSTALYGARAANGVIIISTKKGATADPKLNVNYTTGISSRAIQEYDRVDAYDYYPLFWQALKNNRMYSNGDTEAAAITYANNNVGTQLVYNPFNVPANQLVTNDGKLNANASLLYNDFDWFGEMQNNGARNEASLDYSAKQAKSDYYVSLGYTKDNGFIIGSDFERINGRISVNSTPKSWLKLGVNLAGSLSDSNLANATSDNTGSNVNPFVFARGIGPIYPVRAYTATGEPVLDSKGVHMYDYGMHPGAVGRPSGAYPGRNVVYETLLNTNRSGRNSITGRTFAEISFLKHFKFTTNLAIDLANTRGTSAQSRVVGDGVTNAGTSTRSSNEYRNVSFNQLLKYERQFGVHSVKALAGHEIQKVDNTFLSGNRRLMNLDGNIELVNYVTLNGLSGSMTNLRRDAYLSKVEYGFNNKIFADVSYRRDASSRFSPKSRWGDFYSVGAAWNLTSESFLKDLSWLSNLKLRAAYGTVGNDALDTYYEYQALYSITYNNATEPGALNTKLANEDLTWEVNKTFTAGLDFALFNNRIDGSIDWFKRGSSQLLFDVPFGLSSVVTTRTENIGAMSNRGFEILLNAKVIRGKDFKWDVQLNNTFVKNKITSLPGGNPITSGTKRLEEGNDIYAFYLRQWYGADPANGQALWLRDPSVSATATGSQTINNVNVTSNPNNALWDYSGSAIPDYFGSLNNTFTYKGISLSFLLNYQLGGKFYDSIYAGLFGLSYGTSVHKDALNSWSAPGENNNTPRLDIANYGTYNTQSSRFLIDASYLSIRNVTLGYNIPKSLVSKTGLQRIRVFASGENIYMFSKRKGLNPMESFNGTNSNIYVPNRYVSAGLNVTF
ncbi:SusC/RagA family TonB-linked outer membrane protein [Pedobacter xixiisoli]|uniref:TonB-linked outer membrane protein, SusC/RagA family n=1 Tax=Pedobacter xixiisoli TaxID=1476464 RepID=A0A286ADS4_9SPHI|nr:TonB-dependent receptor [Pedobacter xixiisoli]SOD20051.1 TonB-linked outer membrane protein, SusC/RagA family [Pedobacter xixiisoli]